MRVAEKAAQADEQGCDGEGAELLACVKRCRMEMTDRLREWMACCSNGG